MTFRYDSLSSPVLDKISLHVDAGEVIAITGKSGSGKSTFCELMYTHCETIGRRMHVINLDPAADAFSYPVSADIRSLISLEDVMAE